MMSLWFDSRDFRGRWKEGGDGKGERRGDGRAGKRGEGEGETGEKVWSDLYTLTNCTRLFKDTKRFGMTQ